ncbi:MAG: hypothetical protein CEN91_67 [Candidatus Berkelbacteria bacterium Licking1014_85]|uniref:Uncharacterized protein n=1 Tax=Candidatus Berkelbacteria bacterium Licking1014_85 TaxID=2017148 RepID=A0A554LM24_9BACT|nr:MAG: hypothetical protein CEN91_67 [Candidatus Berkelbacteria bacterium Licking1014_85]
MNGEKTILFGLAIGLIIVMIVVGFAISGFSNSSLKSSADFEGSSETYTNNQ